MWVYPEEGKNRFARVIASVNLKYSFAIYEKNLIFDGSKPFFPFVEFLDGRFHNF